MLGTLDSCERPLVLQFCKVHVYTGEISIYTGVVDLSGIHQQIDAETSVACSALSRYGDLAAVVTHAVRGSFPFEVLCAETHHLWII